MKILPFAVLLVMTITSPKTTFAATFNVTNINDAGAGSLRQAIIDANTNMGADEIEFIGLTYPATINLSTGELQIVDELLINGPGRDSLILNANSSSRCFNIESGIFVEIRGLNIELGLLATGGGAGIYSLSDLHVRDCYFYGNTSDNGSGGSIAVIGASLEIDSCEFLAGIASNGGGVYVTNGSCTINNSTFDECFATSTFGGGVYVINTPLNMNNSYFKINLAIYGGAISGLDSPIITTNCTFYDNFAQDGGGVIYSTNSGTGDASVTLMNVTMLSNILAIQIENTGGVTPVFTTTNSIFDGSDSYETIGAVTTISNGHNICSDTNMDAYLTNSGDLTSTNALLSLPAYNGGFTRTCRTDCYSPAINAGTNVGAPTSDQRGTARLGVTDIGAYENINPPQPPYEISETICYGDSIVVGYNVYTTSGIYHDTLTASTSCDSIIITTLTVDSLDNSVSVNSATLTSNQNGGTYQWYDCSLNSIIPGETEQSFTPESNGNYAVIVSIGSCSDTSDCSEIADVGINQKNEMEIHVYPNPSDGNFGIELPTSNTPKEVSIFSLSGELVHTEVFQSSSKQLNLNLNSGTYILELKHELNISRKRIFIE